MSSDKPCRGQECLLNRPTKVERRRSPAFRLRPDQATRRRNWEWTTCVMGSQGVPVARPDREQQADDRARPPPREIARGYGRVIETAGHDGDDALCPRSFALTHQEVLVSQVL